MKQTKRTRSKIRRRLLATVTAAVLLLSGMTALAADKPVQAQNPTWQDVFDLFYYIQKTVDARNPEYVDVEDTNDESPYYAEGTYLVSGKKSEAFAEFTKDEAAFNEHNLGEGETELTGDAASSYPAFFTAGIALADSVIQADGTKYVNDISSTYDNFWTGYDEPLWAKVENGQIIPVDNEADAPDTATMSKGTYWVLSSDLSAYENTLQTATDKSNNWRWDATGHFSSTRVEMEWCIETVTDAYNTLLGKLHEGSAEDKAPEDNATPKSSSKADSPAEPLKEASYVRSQPEEAPAPVLINEVTFSGGNKSQSSLEGVYCHTFTAGTVYTDEPLKIKQAAGLSEKEIADGVVMKYFICTSRNKAMNKLLSQDVSEQGYQVLGIMNNDLYKLAKGTITKIKTTGEALTIVLGIPETLRNGQYEFVVMCYDESGKLVIMPDIDTDKATVTIQASSFGYWAVGYRTVL